jgi:hypothetical protein
MKTLQFLALYWKLPRISLEGTRPWVHAVQNQFQSESFHWEKKYEKSECGSVPKILTQA